MTDPQPVTSPPPTTGPIGPSADWPTFEGRPLADPTEPVVDQGLQFDVATLLGRRQLLKLLGLGGVAAGIAACAPGAGASSSAAGSAATSSSSDAAGCAVIPEETAGPYPGDGTNGPDILEQSGVVRQDIRSSFGSSTTTATGIPLAIRLAIQDASDGCVPYAGAAVYLWHCDAEGRYSMYSQGVENENYLRGVQEADADGVVTFTSIFPACYQGRWPHLHFEVYPSLDLAIDAGNRIATSQLAFPADVCETVYATAGYESSQRTFPQVSLETDMVFADDGGASQLGTVEGSVDAGYRVVLTVPVASA
jgi:protocatechuate 3,4-dioxygenase beta subunit